MFYNTISLEGAELSKAKADTSKQEELIKAIFKKNPSTPISPSEILDVISSHYKLNWPLTSIRRAITNLTDDTVLIKLSTMKDGIYGKPEHTWRWNQIAKQQNLF